MTDSISDRAAHLDRAIRAAERSITEVVRAWHRMTDDEVFAWRRTLPRGGCEPAPDVCLPILLKACAGLDDARAWRTLDDARNDCGDEEGFTDREFYDTTVALTAHEAARVGACPPAPSERTPPPGPRAPGWVSGETHRRPHDPR